MTLHSLHLIFSHKTHCTSLLRESMRLGIIFSHTLLTTGYPSSTLGLGAKATEQNKTIIKTLIWAKNHISRIMHLNTIVGHSHSHAYICHSCMLLDILELMFTFCFQMLSFLLNPGTVFVCS